MDGVTLETTWDQDFELELVGAHTMKVQICSKSLLKEETYAHGKIRVSGWGSGQGSGWGMVKSEGGGLNQSLACTTKLHPSLHCTQT